MVSIHLLQSKDSHRQLWRYHPSILGILLKLKSWKWIFLSSIRNHKPSTFSRCPFESWTKAFFNMTFFCSHVWNISIQKLFGQAKKIRILPAKWELKKQQKAQKGIKWSSFSEINSELMHSDHVTEIINSNIVTDVNPFFFLFFDIKRSIFLASRPK